MSTVLSRVWVESTGSLFVLNYALLSAETLFFKCSSPQSMFKGLGVILCSHINHARQCSVLNKSWSHLKLHCYFFSSSVLLVAFDMFILYDSYSTFLSKFFQVILLIIIHISILFTSFIYLLIVTIISCIVLKFSLLKKCHMLVDCMYSFLLTM